MKKILLFVIAISITQSSCLHSMTRKAARRTFSTTVQKTTPTFKLFTQSNSYQPHRLYRFTPSSFSIPKPNFTKIATMPYSEMLLNLQIATRKAFKQELSQTLKQYARTKRMTLDNLGSIQKDFVNEFFQGDLAKYFDWQEYVARSIKGKFIFGLMQHYEDKLATIGLTPTEKATYLAIKKDVPLRSYEKLPKKYYTFAQTRKAAKRPDVQEIIAQRMKPEEQKMLKKIEALKVKPSKPLIDLEY